MTRLFPTSVMSVALVFGFALAGIPNLHAQTATPTPATDAAAAAPGSADPTVSTSAQIQTTASKLEQSEATYQLNLRRIHAPILQDYLAKLEALHSQFTAQGNTEHAQQVQAEIQKVREIIATTGILPLIPSDQPGVINAASPTPQNTTQPTLALNASEATTNTNKQATLPLGSISWNLNYLPGGLYEVRLIYDAVSLPKDEMITLNIGPHQLNSTIRSDQVTGETQSAHIANLGQLMITANLVNTTATIHNTTPLTPYLQLRNLVLVPVSRTPAP